MKIEITKTQAAMIQELLLSTGMQPQAVSQAMDLYKQCQAVRDEPEQTESTEVYDAPISEHS